MLKVRLQGTVKDIQWFGKLLEQHPKIRVLGVSKPFANKGTRSLAWVNGVVFTNTSSVHDKNR